MNTAGQGRIGDEFGYPYSAITREGPITLKNCPFCNSEAKSEYNSWWNRYIVGCANRRCGVCIMGIDQREVVQRWNTRVVD